MCRVHSLVLWILVAFEVASLMLALGEGRVSLSQAEDMPGKHGAYHLSHP